jgi:hypothetical protein
MQPNLLLISNKRYATDFRKYLMRAAVSAGGQAVHIYVWEAVIVSYDGREQHTLAGDAFADVLSILDGKFGQNPTVALTGLGGYIHPFPFALAKQLKNTELIYDVYDDYSYGARGWHRMEKIRDDMRWRRANTRLIVLSKGLKRWYPFAYHLDNASHCSFCAPPRDLTRFVYIGSIDSRVDFDWIRKLSDTGVKLDMYGRVHASDQAMEAQLNEFISGRDNVRYLGAYDNDDVTKILSNYSVGIVPYKKRNRMTKYVNPDKLYHYLNCGLEVVSSSIPQARRMGAFVHLIDTNDNWAAGLRSLSTPRAENWPSKQYTWDERWRQLRRLVAI